MSRNNDDDSYNENTCVVCFKNVDIYSVGDCDHPVCYECSTRMRVLCRQNECPICRHDMQKVGHLISLLVCKIGCPDILDIFPKYGRLINISSLQPRQASLLRLSFLTQALPSLLIRYSQSLGIAEGFNMIVFIR